MSQNLDPFVQFKANQRTTWAGFAANEAVTTPPAAELVAFAGIRAHETVLDVGCGTGVVAVTAARTGARVKGLDLTPVLLERARENAAVAEVDVEFTEGDAEALPYPDGSFDAVLSQFGHMFAPRPEVALAEMLRVLKPGGRLAFTTWPPEHGMGKFFALIAGYLPPPPEGAARPAPPMQWGNPDVIRARLGDAVSEIRHDRGIALISALSPKHARLNLEETFGPLKRALEHLQGQPDRVAQLRAQMLKLIEDVFAGNRLRQHFLMTLAVKKP